jgi:hypothetical protein
MGQCLNIIVISGGVSGGVSGGGSGGNNNNNINVSFAILHLRSAA